MNYTRGEFVSLFMVAGSVNTKSGSRATTRGKEVGRLHEFGEISEEKEFNIHHFAHKLL